MEIDRMKSRESQLQHSETWSTEITLCLCNVCDFAFNAINEAPLNGAL